MQVMETFQNTLAHCVGHLIILGHSKAGFMTFCKQTKRKNAKLEKPESVPCCKSGLVQTQLFQAQTQNWHQNMPINEGPHFTGANWNNCGNSSLNLEHHSLLMHCHCLLGTEWCQFPHLPLDSQHALSHFQPHQHCQLSWRQPSLFTVTSFFAMDATAGPTAKESDKSGINESTC